jgi:hypothetical protein
MYKNDDDDHLLLINVDQPCLETDSNLIKLVVGEKSSSVKKVQCDTIGATRNSMK